MKIKTRLIAILVAIMVLMMIAILCQNIATYKNEEQNESSRARYLSYLLADEFRQTSLDLTRLSRAYVVTGEQKYWDAYWDIAKWRAGDIARPNNVNEALYPGQRKKQSDIMVELNFSKNEFYLLDQATKKFEPFDSNRNASDGIHKSWPCCVWSIQTLPRRKC